MDRIDQSLDDIIKRQKQEKKAAVSSNKKGGATAGGSQKSQKNNNNTIPKKIAGGVKSRAAIRAERAIRTAKPNSPYARPTAVKKETALFTAAYQAAKAPVKEIFTAGYIAKPKATLKLYTTNYKAGLKAGVQQQQQQQQRGVAPLTSKPMKLVTTQQVKRESSNINNRNNRNNNNNLPSVSLHTSRNERIPSGPRIPESSAHSTGRQNDQRRQQDDTRDRRPANHQQNGSLNTRLSNNSNHSNNFSNSNNNISNQRRAISPVRREPSPRVQAKAPEPTLVDLDMDMDMEDGPISIRGSAPGAPGVNVAFRGESGPVTVEIENLDPETTADDVKYVCSRFGEIKSCVCTHGFSQVTYARKAAGLAAIENLNGKKADNGKILRVTMRANAIIHQEPVAPAVTHVPTAIAGPMKILTRAVHGTMTNAGTLYSDQLLAAQQMLKVQQHRMAQLAHEEQRISSLRSQGNPQLSDLNSLSTSGVNRGFF
ncbi:hypothetical protein BGZ83_001610 [Gryganskiella cystojenkinii]|nr:hypothetical protein BGZ83_001610 [Gryganskiella cystojenkinii]